MRAWCKRHERELERLTGMRVFTKRGTINVNLLRRLHSDKELLRKVAGPRWRKIWQKVHFALNVRK